MKKLANTSPFLLLLVPVFIVILLTFITAGSDRQNEDLAVKAPAMKTTLIKVVSPFSK
ncbi:hypothetical protein D3C87_93270 [compost metagenome]|uniref:hypothetical protein n=1 Tax=Pedobacter sp. ok626 TaxID=1761882 RepID=UPI000891930D|nr:hypothetical protein [Pedobacter sp. ok626]SDK31584.1 hypothetical protein SAMN04487898_107179 [Pedobacter sp. ok626]